MNVKQAAGVASLLVAALLVGWLLRAGGVGSTTTPAVESATQATLPAPAAETRRLVHARPSTALSFSDLKDHRTADVDETTSGNAKPDTTVSVQEDLSNAADRWSGRGQVAGHVRWHGAPLRDACIQVFPAKGGALRIATSGADGAYLVQGVPEGPARVDASHEGHDGEVRRITMRVEVTAGAATQADLDFTGDATLEGKVTLDGEPADTGMVTAIRVEPSGLTQSVSARLDAYGRYYLEGTPPGELTLMAAASREGQEEKRRTVAVTLTAGATMTQNIDMRGGSAVTGRLTGLSHGESVLIVAVPGAAALRQGITLERMLDLQHEAAAMTRAGYKDGEYRLAGLEPGTYTLAAIAGAGASADDVTRCRIASCDLEIENDKDSIVDFDMSVIDVEPAAGTMVTTE